MLACDQAHRRRAGCARVHVGGDGPKIEAADEVVVGALKRADARRRSSMLAKSRFFRRELWVPPRISLLSEMFTECDGMRGTKKLCTFAEMSSHLGPYAKKSLQRARMR